MNYAQTLACLIVAHALADYPLQGDFLAKAKNAFIPLPGVPWWQAMAAHSVIHGGFVFAITGSLLLGCAEAITHGCIDYLKCRGAISFSTDQWLHLLCKGVWVTLLAMNGGVA